jgi:hypothetical protein
VARGRWGNRGGGIGAYIAHNDFGVSLQEIRVLAAIVASTIATLLAIECFGRKLRKSKQ